MVGEEECKHTIDPPGKSPLNQHDDLLSTVGKLDELLSTSIARTDAYRARLVELLEIVVQELTIHFEAERRSQDRDFEDDPRLRAVFQDLDREHPVLRKRFKRALDALEQEEQMDDALALAARAVSDFRDHEAREDALFLAN